MLSRDQVIERVKAMAQASVDPTLTDDQVGDVVDQAQTFQSYAASTAYTVGQIVQPSAPNGHRYECTTAGTTAASAPTWPTSKGSSVTDGTVTWTEAGPAHPEQYDVRRATYLAWLLKAGEATASYTFSSDGQSFNRSDLIQHCLEMADRYRPLHFA
jgi:hypothetical protein